MKTSSIEINEGIILQWIYSAIFQITWQIFMKLS